MTITWYKRCLCITELTGIGVELPSLELNWLGILYRSRNWIGIDITGIGIELQKRNWPRLCTSAWECDPEMYYCQATSKPRLQTCSTIINKWQSFAGTAGHTVATLVTLLQHSVNASNVMDCNGLLSSKNTSNWFSEYNLQFILMLFIPEKYVICNRKRLYNFWKLRCNNVVTDD